MSNCVSIMKFAKFDVLSDVHHNRYKVVNLVGVFAIICRVGWDQSSWMIYPVKQLDGSIILIVGKSFQMDS